MEDRNVNERSEIITDANENYVVKRPWYDDFSNQMCFRRPSGIPEDDTNAHIFELHKEHRKILVSESSKLQKHIRQRGEELRKIRESVQHHLVLLENAAKKLESVSKLS